MRRMVCWLVTGVFLLFCGLAACDRSKSGGIEDCGALLDHMESLKIEGTGTFEKKREKMVELCNKGNLVEKHSETIACLEKAETSEEAEKCDGVQAMIMSWGMAGMDEG